MMHADEKGVSLLALDAMGVIFRARDDVRELLCPFILERGGTCDDTLVNDLYTRASLGRLTAGEFWAAVGLDPALEDIYLVRHCLSHGVQRFLREACGRGLRAWCLSNDVGQWSLKLRERFGLGDWLECAVISGDVGIRKPDPAIYRIFLERAGLEPGRVLFVDDKPENLDAAASLGIRTVLFNPRGFSHGHRSATGFVELSRLLGMCC